VDSLNRLVRHPRTIRISGIVIGLLFVLAGLAKLGDLRALAEQVHNYRIVPIWSENLIALSLPWIEILAGLSLVLRIRPRAGAVVCTALMALFTAGILAAMARGLDFECGCFGTADAARVGLTTLARDLGMLSLALIATLRPR
jgi:putative oxidoreductase